MTLKNSASAQADAICRRLDHERYTLARLIAVDLKRLSERVDVAIDRLAEGDAIDAQLLTGSVLLAERIACWNLVCELASAVKK